MRKINKKISTVAKTRDRIEAGIILINRFDAVGGDLQKLDSSKKWKRPDVLEWMLEQSERILATSAKPKGLKGQTTVFEGLVGQDVMSVAQICKKMDCSRSHFDKNFRKPFNLTNFGIGNKHYFSWQEFETKMKRLAKNFNEMKVDKSQPSLSVRKPRFENQNVFGNVAVADVETKKNKNNSLKNKR